MNYKPPYVTPAQVLAGISTVVGLLVANLWISNRIGREITDIAAVVVPAIFIAADAYIRAAHVKAAATVNAATGIAPVAPPTTKSVR